MSLAIQQNQNIRTCIFKDISGEKQLIFSDFERKIFSRVVKAAFYVSRGTWGFEKREHVHSEMDKSSRESLHTEGMNSFW